MELLSVLDVLARQRLLVALGVLAAVLVGLAAAGRLPAGPGSSQGAASGIAQARVLIDHRKAVVADTGEISDTVGTQAALLADVISGDAQRDAIARRAGIAPSQLGMQRMQLGQLVALGQLAERAAQVSAIARSPYVVNVWAATPLPVLTIDVLAPSAAAARRVVRATRAELESVVQRRAPSTGRAIVVRPLGGVRGVDVPSSSPSPVVAAAAALVFLVIWLCGVVVLTGLRRAWRNATRDEPADALAS